jgi:signal peptidase I
LGEKNKKNKSKREELEIETQEVLWEENKLDEDTKKSLKDKEEKSKEDEELTFTWEVIDFFKDLVVIVLIVLFIRTFLAMPFQINGQSMYGSYYDREFIIVDRLSYRVWTPERWDVVVFKPNVSLVKEFFLKRIIWVPGDSIRIEEWKVSVKVKWSNEFVELDEVYLNEENKGYTFVGWLRERKEYKVPNNEFFVLWDNRNHSTDSRHCFSSCSYPWSSNFVRDQDLTGKVFLDLWYFNFSKFDFTHPKLGIDTTPKFLNSPKNYEY